jgi:predicted DCC family thiol-disulfide oxidoreductase YuxK
MRALTVLYDARCGFCSACRHWLEGQAQLVRLEFLPAGSPTARRRFPTLVDSARGEELVVVSDEGGVYRGPQALIMCFWALEDYRDWSFRLARPSLLPVARDIFAWVSVHRGGLSWLLRMRSDEEVAAAIGARRPCATDRCAAPKAEGAR